MKQRRENVSVRVVACAFGSDVLTMKTCRENAAEAG
jgi:hypothetical protein